MTRRPTINLPCTKRRARRLGTIDAIQGPLISLGISARPEFTESTVHSPQFFARGSDALQIMDAFE
jgi:hypothetical protein